MIDYPGPIPYISFDTNCLNSKGRIPEMTYLYELSRQELLDLGSGQAMWDELPNGHGPLLEKACETQFRGGELLGEQFAQYRQFRQIIFPGKSVLGNREDADIRHLINHLECQNSHWSYFVTNDHHFLECRQELLDLSVLVGTPKECIQWLGPILHELKRNIQHWEETRKGTPEP